MGKQHVIARLRPLKDDDIRLAMDKLPIYYDEADIVREALRQLLFGHTGREPMIKGVQLFSETTITELDKQDQVIMEDVSLDNTEDNDDLDAKLNEFLTS
ncbi:hypothetical protein [Paenibacillus sp. LK1]|uniref:hypothetical protein n=1 Tax=Paenibacillus sp. LK1 TaxID=2053014 RepID=UPI000C184D69|nr:hypothetical protein [Paenibacillus sp. LK1]PIH59001.1 hypothetical protein CS562_13735 [Paenibacillus sp. LK1]